jgi:hypothetical protein
MPALPVARPYIYPVIPRDAQSDAPRLTAERRQGGESAIAVYSKGLVSASHALPGVGVMRVAAGLSELGQRRWPAPWNVRCSAGHRGLHCDPSSTSRCWPLARRCTRFIGLVACTLTTCALPGPGSNSSSCGGFVAVRGRRRARSELGDGSIRQGIELICSRHDSPTTAQLTLTDHMHRLDTCQQDPCAMPGLEA